MFNEFRQPKIDDKVWIHWEEDGKWLWRKGTILSLIYTGSDGQGPEGQEKRYPIKVDFKNNAKSWQTFTIDGRFFIPDKGTESQYDPDQFNQQLFWSEGGLNEPTGVPEDYESRFEREFKKLTFEY